MKKIHGIVVHDTSFDYEHSKVVMVKFSTGFRKTSKISLTCLFFKRRYFKRVSFETTLPTKTERKMQPCEGFKALLQVNVVKHTHHQNINCVEVA